MTALYADLAVSSAVDLDSDGAAAECAVLTASSADRVRRTHRLNRGAGVSLAPYALWCGFATVLSTAIARLNPGPGRQR